jgi:uncharacterized protein
MIIMLIGIITGISIGLLGVGSGVILIPSLTLFTGIPLKEAICIGLFLQAIPQTIPGFLLYYKKGYFKMYNSVILLISSFIGISIGSYINYSDMISEKHLYCLLSVFLVLSGLYTYYVKVFTCDK